jgi:hypothetical protein
VRRPGHREERRRADPDHKAEAEKPERAAKHGQLPVEAPGKGRSDRYPLEVLHHRLHTEEQHQNADDAETEPNHTCEL